MDIKPGIPELRSRLDDERRRFASLASDLAIDEPTRHFLARALDSFERLDLDLRSLDYAGRNADSGGPDGNSPGSSRRS